MILQWKPVIKTLKMQTYTHYLITLNKNSQKIFIFVKFFGGTGVMFCFILWAQIINSWRAKTLIYSLLNHQAMRGLVSCPRLTNWRLPGRPSPQGQPRSYGGLTRWVIPVPRSGPGKQDSYVSNSLQNSVCRHQRLLPLNFIIYVQAALCSQPGIKPASSAREAWSLHHLTTREVPPRHSNGYVDSVLKEFISRTSTFIYFLS